MEKCNLCGKSGKTQRCGGCKSVWYCCREHQQQDWTAHKTSCRVVSNLKKISPESVDESCPPDQYAGTFRWSNYNKFVKLPLFREEDLDLEHGVLQYLAARLSSGSKSEDDKVAVEIADADALSFPVSFLFGIRQLMFTNPDLRDSFRTCKTLNVVALGCAARAEESILRRSSHWSEIGHVLKRQKVHLYLVGPEMSPEHSGTTEQLLPNMSVTCVRGTTGEFLSRFSDTLAASPGGENESSLFSKERQTYVISYNTGMASGDKKLQRSWDADLKTLLDLQVPAIFTCANDHSDLKSERELMEKKLRARYVLFPRKNPMAAVTVLHPPGGRETQWFSANSFIYAVRGRSTVAN